MTERDLQIRFDSEFTSGFSSSNFPKGFLVPVARVGKEEARFTQSFAKRGFYVQDVILTSAVGEQGEATRPQSFQTDLVMSTMGGAIVSFSGFKESWNCVVYQGDTVQLIEIKRNTSQVEGPSRDSWVVPTWTMAKPEIPAEVEESLLELRAFSNKIYTLSPPQRSPELLELAHKAVQELSRRKDEDIDAWARRLARDVADADD